MVSFLFTDSKGSFWYPFPISSPEVQKITKASLGSWLHSITLPWGETYPKNTFCFSELKWGGTRMCWISQTCYVLFLLTFKFSLIFFSFHFLCCCNFKAQLFYLPMVGKYLFFAWGNTLTVWMSHNCLLRPVSYFVFGEHLDASNLKPCPASLRKFSSVKLPFASSLTWGKEN